MLKKGLRVLRALHWHYQCSPNALMVQGSGELQRFYAQQTRTINATAVDGNVAPFVGGGA